MRVAINPVGPAFLNLTCWGLTAPSFWLRGKFFACFLTTSPLAASLELDPVGLVARCDPKHSITSSDYIGAADLPVLMLPCL
jgi:hypothetical protein